MTKKFLGGLYDNIPSYSDVIKRKKAQEEAILQLQHLQNNGTLNIPDLNLSEEELTLVTVSATNVQKLDPKTSKQGKFAVCSKALHPEFTYALVDVAEMSIEKGYQPLNWLNKENKVTALYLIEAAQRHLDQVKLGIDDNTKETKLDGTPTRTVKHAAQVAYNMLMLLLQQQKGVSIDDRLFKNGELREKKD